MKQFFTVIGFCVGVVVLCGLLLGYLGWEKPCGWVDQDQSQTCNCVGKVTHVDQGEGRVDLLCSGINLTQNQISGLEDKVSNEQSGFKSQ